MCGIAGTVYNHKFLEGKKVLVSDIEDALNLLDENRPEVLLDLAWKYKSNINFIRYCKDSVERKKIEDLSLRVQREAVKKREEISKIDKSKTLEPYKTAVKEFENFMDAHWFLSEEIKRWVSTIEELSCKDIKKLNNEQIIFYKDVCKVIHAIDNRLELRGRDSFGLSVVIKSEKLSDKKSFEKIDETYNFYTSGDDEVHTFTFKTCSSIGGLGDNAREIKDLLKKNKYFNRLIQNTKIFSATIMAHTRWASVGAVTVENAHPTTLINNTSNNKFEILSLLNGDIYNYKEIIDESNEIFKSTIEQSSCSNDSLAIPSYLLKDKMIDFNVLSKMSSDLSGSFAIALQHTNNPEKISLIKKGIQGLYLGFSYDGVMFASDVYGLVESCKYFCPVETDTAFEISATKNISMGNLDLTFLDTKNNDIKKIDIGDLQITNITTRDIDKRGYEHFLEKEIFETSDIVERTINGYLQPLESISVDNLTSSISMNEAQIPSFIISNLKERKIKKIIITGMGTCYTAAVAMSMYMRARLRSFIPEIIVEPHVASEGSAFYVEPNMQDTLVIVVAQSGTTVDTNVYVQMAKERGAMSLAIANKREGDVTFIVDGTIYIGEGRDIEIAVPSTKTYTAQVILGYILTLHLTSHLVKTPKQIELFLKDLQDLKESNILIKNSFEKIEESLSVDKILDFGSTRNSWYVLRDSSSNGVCADEIRIKYSENCYQSVSSITLNEATKLNLKDSFITFITEENISKYDQEIIKFCEDDNLIIIISIDNDLPDNLKDFKDSGKVLVLNMPKSRTHFSFLPTVIAGQFLSYYLAVALDQRKQFFVDILGELNKKIKTKDSIERFNLALKERSFDQGFTTFDIERFYQNLDNENEDQSKVFDNLNYLIEQSRRTIDTIKHQAKTITVGAVRENLENKSFARNSYDDEINSLETSETILIDEINDFFYQTAQQKQSFDNTKEILIAHHNLDESYAYNIVNFINYVLNKFNFKIKARLAHDYDYPKSNGQSNFNWILLNKKNAKDVDPRISNIEKENLLTFEYDDPVPIFTRLNLDEVNLDLESRKSIWSLSLSIFISSKIISDNYVSLNIQNDLLERLKVEFVRNLNSLRNAFHVVSESSEIKKSIKYAAKVYLTRKNWKCIGSGVNYNLSKFASKRLIKKMSRACAFDVLENHKHIDMSAESSIIVFISNIWKHGYQEDAFAEIEKLISHNSLPIIVTNENDSRFDNFSLLIEESYENFSNLPIPIIKLPKIEQQFSFSLNVYLIEKLILEMKTFIEKNKSKDVNISALELVSKRAAS